MKNQNTGIPSKVEGLLRITVHRTFSKAWNTSVFIVLRLFLISIKFVKMSWIKASTKAGLSGLTPHEAAQEPQSAEHARPPQTTSQGIECKYTLCIILLFCINVEKVEMICNTVQLNISAI